MQLAARLRALPTASSGEVDRLLAQQRAQGVDVISLAGINPDLPPPPRVVEMLAEASRADAAHRLVSSRGLPTFRAAIARWYNTRFKLSLNPHNEVVPINGAREGLSYVPWLVANPGDIVLIPDPGYRLYGVAAELSGARVVSIPLLSEHDFLPDLKAIPQEVAARARLLFLNYPNNPTGATAPARFYHDVVAFAKQYDVVVCQDMAFSEVAFDNTRLLSLLEIPGAMDVAIEFHSFSVTYNMSGYRVGMAVGNQKLIEALSNLKAVMGATLPTMIQRAAITALESTTPEWFQARNQVYARRRDRVVTALETAGLRVGKPKATPCLWASVPAGQTSLGFATDLLAATGVWVMPGSSFGPHGEGFVRVSLTVPDDRLGEAMLRIVTQLARPAAQAVLLAGERPLPTPVMMEREKEAQHGPLGA